MPCLTVTTPGGHRAIVCTRPGKLPICSCGDENGRCGQRAPFLCDWKLPTGGTCDRPLCEKHTASPAAGKDLCPAHAFQWDTMLRQKTAQKPQEAP